MVLMFELVSIAWRARYNTDGSWGPRISITSSHVRLRVGAHTETTGSDRCSNWIPCQKPRRVGEGPSRKQNPPNVPSEGTLMKKSL